MEWFVGDHDCCYENRTNGSKGLVDYHPGEVYPISRRVFVQEVTD